MFQSILYKLYSPTIDTYDNSYYFSYLPENVLTNLEIVERFPEWSAEKVAGKMAAMRYFSGGGIVDNVR